MYLRDWGFASTITQRIGVDAGVGGGVARTLILTLLRLIVRDIESVLIVVDGACGFTCNFRDISICSPDPSDTSASTLVNVLENRLRAFDANITHADHTFRNITLGAIAFAIHMLDVVA